MSRARPLRQPLLATSRYESTGGVNRLSIVLLNGRDMRKVVDFAEPWDATPSMSLRYYLRMDADKWLCGRDPDSQYVELAVEVFSMLADATRVRLILALREVERPVNELAGIVGKSPAAVSQHLAKLRLARIVATRQEGTRVFYRLENEHARQLVSDAIFQAEHSLGGLPRHHHPQPEGVS